MKLPGYRPEPWIGRWAARLRERGVAKTVA